ncbi:MAG: hypothetical protein L6408_06300 [Nanoarchaeota archaeon]|nr:hypothetical protein [Nanoarchaeota archaeon]
MKNKKSKTGKVKHDFDGKKAVAPIISLILLLGLAVGLATAISLWQFEQTENLGSSMVRFASGVMECNEINFNVYAKDGCTKTTIKNGGYFNVDGFVVRSFSNFGAGSKVREDFFVKAQESDTLEIGLINADRIEVTPIIEVEGELVGCKDKVREAFCEGLDDLQAKACETADAQGNCNLLEGSGIVDKVECCDYLTKCC